MKATQEEQARIEAIAKQVATRFGYEDTTAELSAFADFKLRWTRCRKSINFQVSDYLCGAPDEVLNDIFTMVIQRIDGLTKDYSLQTREYLTDRHFAGKHRRTYLARQKIDPKKYTEFKGIPVYFYKSVCYDGRVGGASTLMRAIALNPALKDESEDVILNAIKYEYNGIQEGLARFGMESEKVECDKGALKGYIL